MDLVLLSRCSSSLFFFSSTFFVKKIGADGPGAALALQTHSHKRALYLQVPQEQDLSS
jgi:hypothetical protein